MTWSLAAPPVRMRGNCRTTLNSGITVFSSLQFLEKKVCRSSLLSGGNVRWPHRILPRGELRWVCGRDRQTDGRTPNRYLMLSATRGQSNYVRVGDDFLLTLLMILQIVSPHTPFHASSPFQAVGVCRTIFAANGRGHVVVCRRTEFYCSLGCDVMLTSVWGAMQE